MTVMRVNAAVTNPAAERGEPQASECSRLSRSAAALSVVVVIPAYNEEGTIAQVVTAARTLTEQVVVASDGSEDDTAGAARRAGAFVVELSENAGKGPALFAALSASREQYGATFVVMLDADLLGLTRRHLDIMLEPVVRGQLDMAIGIFDGGGLMTDMGNKLTPHLSGQRACRLDWLLSVPRLGQERWPEPAITHALKKSGVRWDYVQLPNLGQVMKEEKRGFWKGVRYRGRMYVDLLGFRYRRRKSLRALKSEG